MKLLGKMLTGVKSQAQLGFALSEEFILFVCTCMYAAHVPAKAREGIGSSGDKTAGGSELLQVGAGNQTLVLWKHSRALNC